MAIGSRCRIGANCVHSEQIKPPSTAMPLSRHNSSKSMSSRLPNSFAQSVGPSVGRTASMIGRSQTSMSFHAPTDSRQRSNTSRVRPQTSMSRHEPEDGPTTGKQNCMMPTPSLRSSTQSASDFLPNQRLRKAASVQYMGTQASTSRREISISTMMGNLSLDDERAYDSLSKRNQAISIKENCPPTPTPLRPSKYQLENVTFRRSQKRGEDATVQSTPRQEESRVSIMAPPKTPHSTQQVQHLMNKFEDTLFASARKPTGTPSKSPSKVRSFLTKDSNLRAFTAWDVDERLVDMESQFKALKEVMNLSLTDKKAMEEVIDMAKTRGRHQ